MAYKFSRTVRKESEMMEEYILNDGVLEGK
jgi:hypothetical protein